MKRILWNLCICILCSFSGHIYVQEPEQPVIEPAVTGGAQAGQEGQQPLQQQPMAQPMHMTPISKEAVLAAPANPVSQQPMPETAPQQPSSGGAAELDQILHKRKPEETQKTTAAQAQEVQKKEAVAEQQAPATEMQQVPVQQGSQTPAQATTPVTSQLPAAAEPVKPAEQQAVEGQEPGAQQLVEGQPQEIEFHVEPVPVVGAQEEEEVGMPEQKTSDEIAVEQESMEEKSFGIDTIDLEEPQGNWLFKRIWWERAQERYEKVRSLVDELADFRVDFFVKRTELDKNVLAPFYVALGFGKGEMQEILRQLLERIEKIRSQEEALTEGERSFLADLEGEQKVLEELNIGIEIVGKLDQDIDNAIMGLMEHINQMRSYERDAWEAFKEIARVLSDKKARELFYRIETDWRNVKDLHRYLQQDFTQHFSQVTGRLQQEINRIKKMLEGLAEKGIVFKEQADRLDVLEQQKAEQAAAPAQELEPEPVKKPAKKGWIGWIMQPIVSIGTMVWNIISYPFVVVYQMIFGKPKAAMAVKKFEQVEPAAAEAKSDAAESSEKEELSAT
jgi:hypothetical protein